MPLEIRELIIRATVEDSAGAAQSQPANGSAGDAKEADINLLVEKVLAILREKTER